MSAKPVYWSLLVFVFALLAGCGEDEPKQVTAQSTPTAEQSQLVPEAQPAVAEPDLRYADTTFAVADVSTELYQGRLSAAVTFTAPVPVNQPLSQWLKVETAEGEVVSGEWATADNATTLYFPHLKPEAKYSVTVLAGMPSQLDKAIPETYNATIETDTLTPMLGFVGRGNLLAHKLTKGLPVLSRNADSVDIDFFSIPSEKLPRFLNDNRKAGQQEFWQVREYLRDLELVYTGRFDLNVERNAQATSYIPIKQIEKLQAKGAYLAVMRKAGDYNYSYPATWFAVTDLGVHLRVYNKQIDAYISHLSTAKPAGDVELQLLDAEGNVLAEQRASADGHASFGDLDLGGNKSPRLLLASQGNDTTLVRLYGPALDLSEFPVTGKQPQAQTLFLYSARDLYRPGEKVTISGLLRGRDGEMVPGIPLQASLRQPDGRIVSTQTITPGALNYYEVTVPIAADQPTGRWSLLVQLPDQTRSEYSFHVEEFLPERMTLELDGPEQVTPQEGLAVQVSGQYLYGAPAVGNKLQSELVVAMHATPFENFSDYHFGDIRYTELNRRVDLDDLKLDDQGNAVLKVKPFWQNTRAPIRLRLFESLQDMGGRPVSRAFTSFVLPADKLVGIRPLFADNTTDYNGNAAFELVYTDGEQKLAREDLEVTLVREHRRYHWVYSDSEGWSNHYTERQYPVFSQTTSIGANEVTEIEAPVEWGYYRLEVKDPQTGLISSYRFKAGWSEQEQALSGRPDRIGMSLDKAAYKAGDTVQIRLQPPAAGEGYLIVEGDQPLHWQKISVPAEGGTLELQVDPSWQRHDLYISVLLVQPGEARETRLPRRMMGIQPLKLSREERKLDIAMTLPAKALPEQALNIPLQITASEGTELPEQLGITVAAVDLGVLNITRFDTPSPFDGFFGQRRYGVDARDSYGALIDADDGELATLRFGGDADLQRGGDQPASDVQIVSLFSGMVTVDENGQAQLPIQFPDFNGRVRLMAVAFGEDRFGSAEQELQVAAPLVTELVKPRFLAIGDESQLALQLHNLSGREQQVTIELELDQGLKLLTEAELFSQPVVLADNERRLIKIPVKATEQFGRSSIDIHFSGLEGLEAEAPTHFSRRWYLSSRPAWAPSEYRWQLALAQGDSFVLPTEPVSALMSTEASLSLNLSSRPPLAVGRHIEALRAYPYGCLEQTTSGVFSQLFVNQQQLAQLGIEGESEPARQDAIRLAIQRLLGMQKSSGGFGLWSNQSPEEYWLTIYVTDFLLQARERGYSVPEQNLQKALQRVQRYLRNPRWIHDEYAGDNNRARFAVGAYAAQVLARSGQARLAELRTLYDNRGTHWSALGLYQLGLALNQAGDSQRAAKALHEALVAFNGNRFHSSTYGSEVRDLALALYWGLDAGLSEELWSPLLFELDERLKNRQWLSTQERNALVLAGLALQKAPVDKLNAEITLGDKTLVLSELDQLQSRYDLDSLHDGLTIRNLSTNNSYLSATLSGYSRTLPNAQSEGIDLQRHFYTLDGEPLADPQLQTGDMVLVELAYRLSTDMNHLLIVDLLPAGLELENQNLATSYDLDDLKIKGSSVTGLMQELDIRHQEFRDDRYVIALNPAWRKRGRIFYLARAVSPGVFTLPPTFAEDMYRPELRHSGIDAGVLRITEGQ
ncbi:alpha-2-macroglobulin [Pontibacterium sp.]|uniref:alpha-2-macroglobulin family protein n=1 Tax=Pontibacterium sp. TaxID=2036026 RepID=UPI00351987BD